MAKQQEKEIEQWITVNGIHIPIFDGESKSQAVNRYIAKKNEETKQNIGKSLIWF